MRINCQKAILPIVLTVIVYLMPFQAWAGLWYVDAGITSSGNGTSWGQAVKTIQEAIDLSEAGDEVWVKQGTYLLQATILVYKDIAIYGGFAGIETDRSQRDWENNITIVDGQDSIRCFYVEANATIDGLTIRHGKYVDGAGMYVRYQAPTVRNCIFEDNNANYGGGIYINRSSLSIEDCQFTRNVAINSGGALRINTASATVMDSTFSENFSEDGGSVHSSDSSVTFNGCDFSNPSGSMAGGSIAIPLRGFIFSMKNINLNAVPRITNCYFNNNHSGGNSIYIENCSPRIEYCEFRDNVTSPANTTDAIIWNAQASPIITNCDFVDNIASGIPCMYNSSGSAPIIKQCSFIHNVGKDGIGAILNGPGSSPTFIDCYFEGNGGDSAVIVNSESNATIKNCRFYSNVAAFGGGVVTNRDCSPQIINCIFNDNDTTGSNGIENVAASPLIINSLFIGSSRVGAVLSTEGSSPIITNCILRGEASSNDSLIRNDSTSNAKVTYSNIEGGYPGEGNIDIDPMFVNPANDDFHLFAGSPCIDAGDNSAVPTGINTDLDGRSRFIDDPSTIDTGNGSAPIVDIGAYEFSAGGCVLNSKFEETTLSNGLTYYTDRDYRLTSVPSSYVGMAAIITPNDDRDLTTVQGYLTFRCPMTVMFMWPMIAGPSTCLTG